MRLFAVRSVSVAISQQHNNNNPTNHRRAMAEPVLFNPKHSEEGESLPTSYTANNASQTEIKVEVGSHFMFRYIYLTSTMRRGLTLVAADLGLRRSC